MSEKQESPQPAEERYKAALEWIAGYPSQLFDKETAWRMRAKAEQALEMSPSAMKTTMNPAKHPAMQYRSIAYLEGALSSAKTWSVGSSPYAEGTASHEEWIAGYCGYTITPTTNQ